MYGGGAQIRLIETRRCLLTCARRKIDMENLSRLISSSAREGVSDHEPVDVLQWQNKYLVIEGNHRVRVAQTLCQPYISARVDIIPHDVKMDANCVWMASVKIRIRQPVRKSISLIEQCENFKAMLPTIGEIVDSRLGLHLNGKKSELTQDYIGEAIYGKEFHMQKNNETGVEAFLFFPNGATRVAAIRRVCQCKNGLDVMRKLHNNGRPIFTQRQNRFLVRKMFQRTPILETFLSNLAYSIHLVWQDVTLGHIALWTDPASIDGKKALDDIIQVSTSMNEERTKKIALEWRELCAAHKVSDVTGHTRKLRLQRLRGQVSICPDGEGVMRQINRSLENETRLQAQVRVQVVSDEQIQDFSQSQATAPAPAVGVVLETEKPKIGEQVALPLLRSHENEGLRLYQALMQVRQGSGESLTNRDNGKIWNKYLYFRQCHVSHLRPCHVSHLDPFYVNQLRPHCVLMMCRMTAWVLDQNPANSSNDCLVMKLTRYNRHQQGVT